MPELESENTRVIGGGCIWSPVSFTGDGKDLLGETRIVVEGTCADSC